MKKIIQIIALLLAFLSLASFSPNQSFETPTSTTVHNDVITKINFGKLEDWHYSFLGRDSYYAYYWRMTYLTDQFDKFANMTESEIETKCKLYEDETKKTYQMVVDNMEIEPNELLANKYVGLYFDSNYGETNDETCYLYLIWTSQYSSSKNIVLKEFTVNNKTYNIKNLDELGAVFQFKESNLDIHISVIGGIQEGKPFGVTLANNYQFTSFASGLRESLMDGHEDYFYHKNNDTINFDFGIEPKFNGENAMQLVTHNYIVIEECEVQSHYSLNFGGYIHYAMFNTTIPIDKIYRVDVSYLILNDNKDWWQVWLPENEHQIKKSLTCEKVSGGIFGLSKYQGFSEGSYQSTNSEAINYKYRLHLNYDDNAWNIFSGKEYNEADYKRVSKFQILRLNYVANDQTYDVDVKMDAIEGDTMFITNPDLILDTNTPYYDIKKAFDDLYRNIKEKLAQYTWVFYAILGFIGFILILWILKTIKSLIIFLFKSK